MPGVVNEDDGFILQENKNIPISKKKISNFAIGMGLRIPKLSKKKATFPTLSVNLE
jgi:hypothetical protein